MGYHRLTLRERYRIEALIESGKSIRQTAKALNRSPSTISRELKRLRGRYDASCADQRAFFLKTKPQLNRRMVVGPVKAHIVKKLREDWSPEQISGRMRLENNSLCHPSHQTIYRFIYEDRRLGGKLFKHLRILRRQRKDRKVAKYGTYSHMVKRRMIDERPKIVEKRARLGDFERDTVLGKFNGSVLLTIVDRTSRLLKLAWLPKKTAREAHEATVKLLKHESVCTITNDNGGEFRRHALTEQELQTKVYFSKAYCSWERGTNENLNGLLRQYYPRSQDIGKPTPSELRRVQERLNNRPRKCLGYQTPNEVHYG